VEAATSDSPFAFFETDIKKSWAGHWVVGVEVVLTRHWELFAEFRQIYLSPDIRLLYAPDINTPTTVTPSAFNYDHNWYRVGLNYRF
jgi:hypothetical protein